MGEWTVVTVIATLVGLGVAIIKPLISLNSTIMRLTHVVAGLEERVGTVEEKSSDARGRIWEKISEHEEEISGHEVRLTLIERISEK